MIKKMLDTSIMNQLWTLSFLFSLFNFPSSISSTFKSCSTTGRKSSIILTSSQRERPKLNLTRSLQDFQIRPSIISNKRILSPGLEGSGANLKDFKLSYMEKEGASQSIGFSLCLFRDLYTRTKNIFLEDRLQ